MRVGFKLVESPAQIKRIIIQSFAEEIVKEFKKQEGTINSQIRSLIITAIKNTVEYESLTSPMGRLRGELGLPDAVERMNDILQIWIESLHSRINVATTSASLAISLQINAIKSDYSDVLSSAAATLISDRGYRVPWLEWLLIGGDSVLISDYSIKFNLSNFERLKSRTGLALMTKVQGASYSLPPEFSGSENNNFVTFALKNIEDDVFNIMIKALG